MAAIVVLYQTRPQDSLTLMTMTSSLFGIRDQFLILVHDNSESPAAAADVMGLDVDGYRSQPDNPGLAAAYNGALDHAEAMGCTWLMLLDQDTEVTRGYLEEALATVEGLEPDESLAAVLPRLAAGSRPLSPHRRLRITTRALWGPGRHEAASGYQFYNSGSVVRIAAVRKVGGFPSRYALDYLDHALAAMLRRGGFAVHVLGTRLEHHPALLTPDTVPVPRLTSVLRAEEQFAREFGTTADRFWLLARRVIRSVSIAVGREASASSSDEWKATVRAATLLVRPHRRHRA